MNETIKEIKSRWNAKLNAFWKRILRVSITIGSAAAGIMLANTTFGLEQYVAPIIFTISGYILTACGAMGLTAKLTTE